MTRQTSVQITEATDAQVEYLKAKGFGTFTDIQRIAIDRMAREEGMNRMDPKTAFDTVFLITGSFIDAAIAREKAIRNVRVCASCSDGFEENDERILEGYDVLHRECAEAAADITNADC